MAIGKSGGAYAQSARHEDYLGNALKGIEENKYRYDVLNQDKEQKIAQQKADQDKLKFEKEKDRKEYYKNDVKFSNVKSVDEVALVFATQQNEEIARAFDDYDAGNINNIELQKRISRGKNNINLLSTNNEVLKTGVTNFQTAVKEGKAHPAFLESTRGLQKDLEFGKVVPVSDPESGELLVSRISKNDKGEEIKGEPISFSEFSTNLQKFIPNIDFVSNIKSFKEIVERDNIETYTTNKITGIKELTPRVSDAIDLEVTKSINNDDELSVAYYDATGNAEENITDKEKIEVAKNYLEQKYLKSFGIDKKIQINTSIESLEQKKKQDAIDNANKNEDQALAKRLADAKIKTDAEKLALAKSKASGKSLVSGTKFSISEGMGKQSILNLDIEADGEIVIPKGGVGFSVEGDGLRRVIGEGETSVTEDVTRVVYKNNVIYIEADRYAGEGDNGEPKYEKVYYNSNSNASEVGQYFTDRLNKKGEYYSGVPEVLTEFKKKLGVKPETSNKKTTTTKPKLKTGDLDDL